MKVSLISVYENVVSYGLRSLSAVLKEAGFEMRMVFLPRETEGLSYEGFRYAYAEKNLDQLAELVGDSDLIGISLMTNYFDNAVQVTRHLRDRVEAPIVWGGIHPTLRPEECLQHADLVCVGEGEEALRELAQHLADGQGYTGIDNMWYRQDGEVVRTPMRRLVEDLDVYPYPDYDLESCFVLHEGAIRPMTSDLLLYYLRWPYTSDSVPTYTTMMSRGCPYSCTYCCNNALRNVYGKKWPVRRRSVPNFIGELRQMVTRFPGIEGIKIDDDSFIDDVETLREFAAAYREQVGRPLLITGFRPAMVDEERIGLLVEAGVSQLRMGIQTGSMHVMRHVYRRPATREQIADAIQVLHRFTDRTKPPIYDLIVDNPWETEQDHLETLRMLLEMPKPYQLQMYSLTLYPGTELYTRAKEEGVLVDEWDEIYRKEFNETGQSYTNSMLKLFQSQLAPRWLMELLLQEAVRRRNWVWLPDLLNRLFSTVLLLGKAWRSLRRWDWNPWARALRARQARRHVQAYRG